MVDWSMKNNTRTKTRKSTRKMRKFSHGGAGLWFKGLGINREIEIWAGKEALLIISWGRYQFRPWGAHYERDRRTAWRCLFWTGGLRFSSCDRTGSNFSLSLVSKTTSWTFIEYHEAIFKHLYLVLAGHGSVTGHANLNPAGPQKDLRC